MERRSLLIIVLVAALAGIVGLVVLLTQSPPRPDHPEVVGPPEIAAPNPDELPGAVKQGGTLRGSVINGETGKALPGATVIALRPYLEKDKDDDVPLWGQLTETKRLRTGQDGTFVLKDLPDDYWNLWIEKAGYSWTTIPRVKFEKDHVIKLFPACSLWGKVIYDDGRPAAGVRIEYTPQGTHSEVFSNYRLKAYYIETGVDGTFEYTDLPPGKFTVEAYPEDNLPAPWTAEPPLKPGENRRLAVHKLDSGFGMTVNVRWLGTNAPVEAIEVVVKPIGDPMPRTRIGKRRRTDANGIARFSGLGGQVMDNPTFQITAILPGVGPVEPDLREPIGPDSEVTIYLRRDGIIKGKVVGADGEPVRRFHVSVEPIGFLTRQLWVWGENGEFMLYQVPEGRYTLNVRHGNLVEISREVTSSPGQETDVGTLRMEAGAEIYGTVTRANGAALEGVVKVHLVREVVDERTGHRVYQAVKRAICKTDGTYSLKGVPEGSFLIQVMPEEVTGTNPPAPVNIPAGTGGIQRDLTLHGAGFVKLRFVDLVDGKLRDVVMPATELVEVESGQAKAWTGERTPYRAGLYAIRMDLKQPDGTLQRYEKVKEVTIQEGETVGPIELALHEIRNGG